MFIGVHLRHNSNVKKGLLLLQLDFFAKIILIDEKVGTFKHMLRTLFFI